MSDPTPTAATTNDAESAHAGGHGVLQEPDAVPVGRVLRIGLWGVLVTVVAIWLSAIFLRQDEAMVPAPATHTARLDEDTKDVGILELGMYSARGERPDGPAQKLKAEKEAELRSYGWVDEKAGIIRIPIERAYDQVIVGYEKTK